MVNKIVTLIFAALLFSLLPQDASSGQEKIERFLRKIDVDQDGRVDVSEMNEPIKRYLKSKGFDTNRSVKISSVMRVVAEAKGSVPANTESKVPGFGVDSAESTKSGVLTFGSSAAPEYSESTKKQASDLLRKYDRNRNNVLDADELRRIPWGSPPPSDNDKNGDGRLSLTEIESRYHAREVASKNTQNVSRTRQIPSSTNRTQLKVFKGTGGTPVASTTSSSTSPGVSAKQREKIMKYADGYFQKHDSNKNGMLDADELKNMRRAPTSADTNKDGRVSKSEFVASQMPKTSASRTISSNTKSSSRSGRRDRGSSSSSTRGSTSSSKSSVFGGKDKNNDNILQMHEYADRWTQKTLDAFNKKDTDGDGLITPEEWLKR